MNNKLTDRERVQAVFDLKAGYTLGHADVAILQELARIALEAEPVAWIVHCRGGDQLTTDGDYVANAEGMGGIHSTALYTAPPAPVMPDEITFEQAILEVKRLSPAEAYMKGYRAAMQGKAVNNLLNGYALLPIEPTEDMIIAGFESEPDEHFSKPEAWEAYQAMSGCQQAAHKARLCWDAMIAAAPEAGKYE